MSETKRITVEEVQEAYRVTGIQPSRGTVLGNACCAAGAVARHRGGVNCRHMQQIYSWLDAQYGRDYMDGFINGFDGYDDCNADSRIAYQDGVAARKAVFGEE